MSTIKPFENPYNEMTMVKNVVFDHIMPALSANGWKILCVAIRQTWGWADPSSPTGRKESDQISYSQFKSKTGIKSDQTITRAIRECLESDYLLRFEIGKAKTGKPLYAYALNTDFELITSKNEEIAITSKFGVINTPKNEEMITPKNEETKETKENKQSGGGVSSVDQDALAALLEIGVTPDQAEKWVAANKPEDVIGWCEYVKVAGGITNPPGLVVAMLRDGAPPPPRIEVEPEPEPVPRSPPQAEPPEPIPIPATDLDAREVWSHVLEEMRMQMTQATFDTWLSGSEVVDGGNGTITVRVRDGYAVDWLSERWIKPIQRTLAGVVGQGDLDVEFVAGEM